MQRIFIAGHNGMVGSALCRQLSTAPDTELILRDRKELDLTDDLSVSAFFREQQPDTVIFAAAKVGGIHANNTYPVEFLADNVRMAVNAIQAAYENGVKRFLFLGSTCIKTVFHSAPCRWRPQLAATPLATLKK